MARSGKLVIKAYNGVMDGENPLGVALGPVVSLAEAFMCGHSMAWYLETEPNATPYTNIFRWVARFAAANGLGFAGQGRFGFVPQHVSSLSSSSGTNYIASGENTYVPGSTFGAANPSHFLFMLSNYIAYEVGTPPNYQADNRALRTSEALQLLDIVHGIHSNNSTDFLIFEHQPDFGPYAGGGINPTPTQWDNYISATQGAWHAAHLEYQSDINDPANARPYTAKLCPAGPVIADLFAERNGDHSYLSSIAFSELHSDNSPHGTDWFYFLQAVVLFITIYEIVPDFTNFTVPAGATQMSASIADGDPAAAILSNIDTIAAFFKQRIDYHDANSQGVY